MCIARAPQFPLVIRWVGRCPQFKQLLHILKWEPVETSQPMQRRTNRYLVNKNWLNGYTDKLLVIFSQFVGVKVPNHKYIVFEDVVST